ncbi:MAG: hypothetical protein R2867_40050 [Caldilineaceae bacterium]
MPCAQWCRVTIDFGVTGAGHAPKQPFNIRGLINHQFVAGEGEEVSTEILARVEAMG